jgi:hypothetical protein
MVRTLRKKSKRGKKTIRKNAFINVPITNKKLKGTSETLGSINYHYQKYHNTFRFFRVIKRYNKNIKKLLCIPDVGQSWMRSILSIMLDSDSLDTSAKAERNIRPVDSSISVEKFNHMVRQCNKRFIAISVQLIVRNKPGTHANILIIDTENNTVELFEPHGSRSSDTTMDSLVGAYSISDKLLKKYFAKHFPEYRYISPQENLPSYGLQVEVDAYNGLCVTWCILYLHYKILNPDKSQKALMRYIKKTVNKSFILKYAKYVEDMIK